MKHEQSYVHARILFSLSLFCYRFYFVAKCAVTFSGDDYLTVTLREHSPLISYFNPKKLFMQTTTLNVLVQLFNNLPRDHSFGFVGRF